jgi:signal transduction histidine kinase
MAATRTQLARRHRELEALHDVALDIVGELALDVLLQKIVDRSRSLLQSRYAALSVIDGENRIERFFTAGITKADRARIGAPPQGQGLLGVPLHQGQSLRLGDLAADPRAAGFPANHPPMVTLLAVPLPCKSPFRGNLYLSDRKDANPFTAEDEEILTRLATVAAIAIDNSFLHQQARALAAAEERLRIAREMHDGQAQVLAYVNAKAQAVREHLRAGRLEVAESHLVQLAAAAREVYGDTREAILDLRTAAEDRPWIPALREYLERWQAQNDVPVDMTLDERVKLPPGVDHQVLRIVQEALSNTRKHAQARRVIVELVRSAAGTRVLVADDGVGFAVHAHLPSPMTASAGDTAPPPVPSKPKAPRFGLTSMRERAHSLGATLRIDSIPGQGTRVELLLPG